MSESKTRREMLAEVADLVGNIARAGGEVPVDVWHEAPEYTWIIHQQGERYSIVVQPRPLMLIVGHDGEMGGVG